MTVEYQRRLEKHYDELKWLYCELYPNGQDALRNSVQPWSSGTKSGIKNGKRWIGKEKNRKTGTRARKCSV